MKKTLIHSYLDLNFGDSLLLEILINSLKDYNCLLIANNQFTYQWVIDKFSNIAVTKSDVVDTDVLNNISSFIQIGGSIFQHNNWYDGILRYNRVFTLKNYKKYGIKIFIINCNVGPFSSNIGISSTIQILRMADTLTCRDSFSFNFIKKKCRNQKVKQFADLVFAYDVPAKRNCSIFILGISVYTAYIKKLINLNYQYCSQILDIILYFKMIHSNIKLKFFIFDTFRNNDFPNAYFLANECQKRRINYEIIPYTGCSDIMIDEMSTCNFLIATRFHSLVLSLKMKIPCIPIIYSNKSENLLYDIGYRGVNYRFGEKIHDLKKINAENPYIISENKLYELVTSAKEHLNFLHNNFLIC